MNRGSEKIGQSAMNILLELYVQRHDKEFIFLIAIEIIFIFIILVQFYFLFLNLFRIFSP